MIVHHVYNPRPGKLRHVDHEFEANLRYRIKLCLKNKNCFQFSNYKVRFLAGCRAWEEEIEEIKI
jgi:hypothetical protein